MPAGRRPVLGWLVFVAAVAVAGFPLGLLWSLIAPDVPLVLVEGGLAYAETQPEQQIAADGWFAILSVPFGVAVAAAGWLLARRQRGSAGLAAVTVGAVLAALAAWWLGRQVGLAGYESTLAAAEPGDQLGRPPDLAAAEIGWWPPRITGVLLVPATVAAAAYTLLAAWSRFPSLRGEDEPEPFVGPGVVEHPGVAEHRGTAEHPGGDPYHR